MPFTRTQEVPFTRTQEMLALVLVLLTLPWATLALLAPLARTKETLALR